MDRDGAKILDLMAKVSQLEAQNEDLRVHVLSAESIVNTYLIERII